MKITVFLLNCFEFIYSLLKIPVEKTLLQFTQSTGTARLSNLQHLHDLHDDYYELYNCGQTIV